MSGDLGKRILEASRNQVYFQLMYMEQALFYLQPVECKYGVMGSDGRCLYYNSDYLIKQFLKEPGEVDCDFLHTVLHCLYRHPWQMGSSAGIYGDIAADIAVMDVIGQMDLPQIRDVIPQECFDITERIRGEVPIMSAQQIERYLKENEAQLKKRHGVGLREMEALFYRDDHSLWKQGKGQESGNNREFSQSTSGGEADENVASSEKIASSDKSTESKKSGTHEKGITSDKNATSDKSAKGGKKIASGNSTSGRNSAAPGNDSDEDWRDIAEAVMQNAFKFSQGRGDVPGSMIQVLQRVTRESYDYAEFLRRFAELNECMKLNMDEFDYLYYIYGMNIDRAGGSLSAHARKRGLRSASAEKNYSQPCAYKKIALIEPLEYKEEYRVRDFVIAIDTSGSCSGELVQNFLNKTYNILKSTESFADKVVIHIIQCDCVIQEDVRIDNLRELENYMAQMQIKGLGGTDFRPVFEYVDRLCAEKEFNHLGGLIYFTDGVGVYPKHPPEYKTAFVFAGREDQVQVPPWAMKLYLDERDIQYEY